MKYTRMAIEEDAPEELGYGRIRNNLSESSVPDRELRDIGVDLSGLTLFYGEHRGTHALRELIASQGGGKIQADDILTCAGAAGALFMVATALLQPASHLVVVRPNYATNIETPRAIGCEISYVDLSFEQEFQVDIDAVEQAIRPNTAYISVTTPHNPTGTMMAWDDLARLGQVAARHGCLMLVDETYRDLAYTTPPPMAATLGEHVISVASLSKAYGVPGIRLGWLATRNRELYRKLLAAKEQIGICGSVVDEAIGTAVLQQRGAWLARSTARNLEQLQIVRQWMQGEPLMEWVEPAAGVVCFPRVKSTDAFDAAAFDADAFHRTLLARHGTYVGAGRWFEMPGRYMRIGFAWPTRAQLRGGLAGISAALREQLG